MDISFEEALVQCEVPIAVLVNKYHIIGYDEQDIYQECCVELWRCMRSYNPAIRTFNGYAQFCMENRLITLLRKSQRQKRLAPRYFSDVNTIDYPDSYAFPLEIMKEDSLRDTKAKIGKVLTKLELAVMVQCYANGLTGEEAATTLNVPLKTIDNAIQRVKKKVRKEKRLERSSFPHNDDPNLAYLHWQRNYKEKVHINDYAEFDPDIGGYWSYSVRVVENNRE